jgi:hypothetical protein
MPHPTPPSSPCRPRTPTPTPTFTTFSSGIEVSKDDILNSSLILKFGRFFKTGLHLAEFFVLTAGGRFEVDERSGVVRTRGSESFQLDMEYVLYVKAEDQNGKNGR